MSEMQVGSIVELGTGRERFVGLESLPKRPEGAFDFIALPKGTVGLEVAYTSAGQPCQVMPLFDLLHRKVGMALTAARLTKGTSVEEVDKAIGLLKAYRDEIAPPSNVTE